MLLSKFDDERLCTKNLTINKKGQEDIIILASSSNVSSKFCLMKDSNVCASDHQRNARKHLLELIRANTQ